MRSLRGRQPRAHPVPVLQVDFISTVVDALLKSQQHEIEAGIPADGVDGFTGSTCITRNSVLASRRIRFALNHPVTVSGVFSILSNSTFTSSNTSVANDATVWALPFYWKFDVAIVEPLWRCSLLLVLHTRASGRRRWQQIIDFAGISSPVDRHRAIG